MTNNGFIMVKCRECKGIGRIRSNKCKRCHGYGYYPMLEYPSYDMKKSLVRHIKEALDFDSIADKLLEVSIPRCRDCVRFKRHPTDPRFYICDPCPFNTEYSPFVWPDEFCSHWTPKEGDNSVQEEK